MKKLLLFSVLLCISVLVFAQRPYPRPSTRPYTARSNGRNGDATFGIGPNLSFFNFNGLGVISGAGLKLKSINDEKGMWTMDLIYNVPFNVAISFPAYLANYSTNLPEKIYVDGKVAITFYELSLMGNYFIATKTTSKFGVYIGVGFSYVFVTMTPNVGKYDDTNYHISENETQYLDGATGNFSLGAQLKLGNGTVFLEPRLCYPADKVNSTTVKFNPIPMSYGAKIGYTFDF